MGFQSLKETHDFADVTLVCEDGQEVEAHRFMLAASSPFFQNMLKRKEHPKSLIYLRGIKYENIISILSYIYNGESTVLNDQLETFLTIASELGLKGLTESTETETETDIQNIENKRKIKNQKLNLKAKQLKNDIVNTTNDISEDRNYAPMLVEENSVGETYPVVEENYSVAETEVLELNEKVKSMIVRGSNVMKN